MCCKDKARWLWILFVSSDSPRGSQLLLNSCFTASQALMEQLRSIIKFTALMGARAKEGRQLPALTGGLSCAVDTISRII